MNTGFSWVRIDKGNIHCNFRYLDMEQVRTVINYLLTYYEYRNVTVNIVDLGADGVLPETGAHYRPSDADPTQDYYFLVELHRHGTIIPQGCIEIMKTALNALAMQDIIPESVFINKLPTNKLTVEDEETLTAVSTKTAAGNITWETSDQTVVSIVPDGFSCAITALSPGSSVISTAVEVPEAEPLELRVMPIPTYYWTNNVYKYVGNTVTYKFDGNKYWDPDDPKATGDPVTFTANSYYECEYDNSAPKKYMWHDSAYVPGTPVQVTYRDTYEIIVRTYVRITTKDIQRICLYDHVTMTATTPSVGAVIHWSTSSDNIDFDGGISTGNSVEVEGLRVGTSSLMATLTDAYGVYEDTCPITVYAIDVTPNVLKMVTGSTKSAVVAKKDIFRVPQGITIVVDWVTSNAAIASVEAVNPTDPVTDFAEVQITAQGVGQAYVTAIAEDPRDGTSYADSLKVTVGNVAINVPSSTVINLLASTTLTLTCDLTAGFAVDPMDGWISGNSDVVEVTTISGTNNNTVLLTGLTEGSALITVTAKNGSAVDTDQILIKVVSVEAVTSGEMSTFIHGMFNGQGVVDWDNPTGEEGTLEVDGAGLDLVTEPEMESFVDDLFDANSENEESTNESSENEESSEENSEG